MRLIPIENTPDPKHASVEAGNADAEQMMEQVIEATLDLYQRKGCVQPWLGYLAVEDGCCVGTCGFAGPPTCENEVEIAYFTFPGNEGRGVATRMAMNLIELTRPAATGSGFRYIAYTLPERNASTNILNKLGFVMQAEIDHPEDGRIWKWIEATSSRNETST